jgi:hypothetical protein
MININIEETNFMMREFKKRSALKTGQTIIKTFNVGWTTYYSQHVHLMVAMSTYTYPQAGD